MSGRNWKAGRTRKLMHSRGTTVAKHMGSFMAPLLTSEQREPRQSKAELRLVTERLVADFTKRRQG